MFQETRLAHLLEHGISDPLETMGGCQVTPMEGVL